jgi:hypothetical protein
LQYTHLQIQSFFQKLYPEPQLKLSGAERGREKMGREERGIGRTGRLGYGGKGTVKGRREGN